jgi:hypothetical protein
MSSESYGEKNCTRLRCFHMMMRLVGRFPHMWHMPHFLEINKAKRMFVVPSRKQKIHHLED